ncbi:Phage integrase family recombinase (plasmid) [Neorhizobium galegae bv. officinalis bv. officinalis str. HAMBI 1141]|uniref:Phage integrase family recombinase n=1 Tax=Neorhizobium galegae bv. officinalis bv. officinalis str. HAMBI 1141 TaxID=1028801 RepID=A0A068TFZ4_NEOGA|nr:tyrosine-type recombinase/integrase [Neorhizobium galegae]CDN57054.1 Phage integrase family recombinase [Neorhizobium galegae bv. officinalis bv. officinalis str. HAMBI 1141]
MRLRLVRPMVTKGSSTPHFVKRIPSDIRDVLVGRKLVIPVGEEVVEFAVTQSTQSIRFSLRTSDPTVAKVRLAEAISYLEQYFEALRSHRPVELSHRQLHALAGDFYRAWSQGPDGMKSLTVVPSTGEVIEGPWADDDEAELLAAVSQQLADKAEQGGTEYRRRTYGPLVDRILAQRNVPSVTPSSRERLIDTFSTYLTKSLATSSRIAAGDYSGDPLLERLPQWEPPTPATKTHEARQPKSNDQAVSLIGLVDAWWSEAKVLGKSSSTYESYKNSFTLLSRFLGHDDAKRVSPENIVDFKDHRLTSVNPRTGKPASPKTVKASDLTAFKSVFDWAVSNRRLPKNPAVGVTVKLGKKIKLRERDFTDGEANLILSAANAVDLDAEPRRSFKTRQMKRWVPWLCAYSGSRVGELVQLRKADFRQEGKAWIMQVTPEAGTVKGKEYRDIPIHEHLLELGFIDYVREAKGEYLFMDLKPDAVFEGVWQSKKNRLSEFVREHVKDPNVAPNHGWRHTFKSKGFEAGIQEKVLDALCGHAPTSVGRSYGSVTLKTKVDALAQFPRYAVDPKLQRPLAEQE